MRATRPKAGAPRPPHCPAIGRRPPMTISLKVNGAMRSVPAEPDTPLLYVLRNDLGFNGAKFGCGLGQCGACTVLIDGQPTRSCMVPLAEIGESEVVTIEGLALNLCRCGTHNRIVRAVLRAAETAGRS